MSGAPDTAPPDAGVRNYTFLGLAALLVLLLVLLERGVGMWALLPVLIGFGSLLLRWSPGPLLVLVTLAGLLFASALGRYPALGSHRTFASVLSDLLLCAAVLAYVAAQYRLHGLVLFLFPRDPRRPGAVPPRSGRPPAGPRPSTALPQRRSPALASSSELVLLLLAVGLSVALALVCRQQLVPDGPFVRFAGGDWDTALDEGGESRYLSGPLAAAALVWRGRFPFLEVLWSVRLLLWSLGAGLLLASALIGYRAWGRLTPAEATLFLQDTAWAETRGEQRRIHSWLVWARLRRSRRKDTP
jgi:hypothetical protein